ncbi:acyltransferase [Nocardioides sp.]|uniref:acyltransferase n=1 Tax=Nocardioides sp. TaxID=35761 RepID=UPI0031FE6447
MSPDPDLPNTWLPRTMAEALPDLARGLARTRRPVFLGARIRIRAAGRITWGRGSRIGRGSTVDGYASEGVVLGPGSRIGDYSTITCTSHVTRLGKGVSIGARTGFGDYCHFGSSGGIVIGDDVLGGSYVSFHSQDHVFSDPHALIRDQGVTEGGIMIGDNCWIGAKVTFLDGAKVGSHSVVAAGAVVKGKFPDHSLIGGVPARLLRSLASSATED